MDYTKSDISKLALNQLSADKLQRAVEAFNGFAKLFGKPWLEKYFHEFRLQSSAEVLYVLSLWEDWSFVKGLKGSEEILTRWKLGIYESGVEAEIYVVAAIVRTGTQVELFPKVGSCVSDFRLQANSQWVYGEVSCRGISKARKRGTKLLHLFAEAAAKAVGGKHGMIFVLRDLEDDEIENLLSWLNSIGDCVEAQLDDIAVFHAGNIESAMGQDESLMQFVPEPKFCATYISTSLKGSACIFVSDRSAQEMLETESAQLPRNEPGVVFLDVSSMIGSYAQWLPLIQRRLQPRINTRISAVLIFQKWLLLQDKPETKGTLILNPHARNPLPVSAVTLLQNIAGESVNRHGRDGEIRQG